MNWKTPDSAPKDGTPLLLFAKLDYPQEEPGPIVGHWDSAVHQWRPLPELLDKGVKLVLSYWTDIPELPTGRASE
jgi:hypothetical protein